jgi:effector-binding domain-containing protein
MIDTPKILETKAQTAALLHLTIPRSEIQQVMGPGLEEVKATLAAQGITARGPWFTRHLKMDPKIFDFEIGVPTDRPVSPQGRVTPGELPASKVARTLYHGGYEGLYSAWAEFGKWITANGHTPQPSLWETYVTDPSKNPDPTTYVTELTQPLVE